MRCQEAHTAKVLPLPVDDRPSQTMAAIMTGGEGTLYGCDLLKLLPIFGVKNLGVARLSPPWHRYSDDIIFLKKEGGGVVAEQVYSAGIYDAPTIREIVAFCETQPRCFPDEFYRGSPSVEELRQRLETV